MKELKVGERVTITLEAVERNNCEGCFFDIQEGGYMCMCKHKCCKFNRSDGKNIYKALIDNQADEEELEYLRACQYTLEVFNKVLGLCPKCRKSVIVDGWCCPCCGYDSSGEKII